MDLKSLVEAYIDVYNRKCPAIASAVPILSTSAANPSVSTSERKKMPRLIKPNGEEATTMSPAQIECIKLLSDMLETAKGGGIFALAVVAVGPEDFGIAIAGSDAPRLNLGLDVAKRTIMDRTSPPVGGRTVLHQNRGF